MKSPRRISRRDLLRSGLGAAALGTAPYFIPANVLGGRGKTAPSDRVAIGVIGTGVRGKYLIGNMPAAGRVVALCDSYLPRVEETLEPRGNFAEILGPFAAAEGRGCRKYQDYRQMIDREKLDAVVIATPDHHHVLAALLACAAGLDIYLEKPLTLTIGEGQVLVDAVKKHKCVLQVGSQQRTMEMNRFACEFVRDGGLGKISHVELPNYPGPIAGADFPKESVPAGLDWDLFCGPTPVQPHNRKLWVKDEFKLNGRVWRGWDLFRAYSGHLTTNWGAHSVDMVQYALGTDDTGPVDIEPAASGDPQKLAQRWLHKTPPPTDARDGARFMPVTVRYASGIELRFSPQAEEGVFHGARGTLRMSRNRFEVDPPELVQDPPDPAAAEKWKGAGHVARPHLANWLDCLKTRGTPNAPVEVGHRTVTICHLVNLARELGRKLKWDPQREQFVGDEEANRLLTRPRRKGFELPAVG